MNYCGKETIDTNSYGKTFGSRGNYSRNDQIAGRELLTPDEVRMLDNKFALLFIRGERPIKDLKFNLREHSNINNTPLAKAKPYTYGNINNSVGSISIDYSNNTTVEITELETNEIYEYELLSEQEIEKLFKENEKIIE